MNERRWREGQRFQVSGLTFRVMRGKKAPDDLRLDVEVGDGEWIKVPMCLGAVLADFFYENEDALYPPPASGGRKYLGYIHTAARHGWDTAQTTLWTEQQRKRGA